MNLTKNVEHTDEDNLKLKSVPAGPRYWLTFSSSGRPRKCKSSVARIPLTALKPISSFKQKLEQAGNLAKRWEAAHHHQGIGAMRFDIYPRRYTK